ncbi:toxin-antitoxin system YwqK family antitoxin [Streptomyces lavendulocolor]|uniref:toxin-antitoxin system YwqK family antitoxin n=1 Tax=Streptomyces lavendulocolor TaxID=67316 RepID=UPI003C2D9EC7
MTEVRWADRGAAADHAGSRAALLREFLRRSAVWARELKVPGLWPFFDIGAHVDASVRAPSRLVDALDRFAAEHVPGLHARSLCRFALHWAALHDADVEAARRHADPFQPLLLLFERGGAFPVENGVVDLAVFGIPLGTWQSHVDGHPLAHLDPMTLDSLDTRGTKSEPPARSVVRIDIDDPDVDMDVSGCLFYGGTPFTGEVAEYRNGYLISLDEYVDGLLHGLSREWYEDGTPRSEGSARGGCAVGEWKEWHPNGTLMQRQLFDSSGYSLHERDTWDENGDQLTSWRRGDGARNGS